MICRAYNFCCDYCGNAVCFLCDNIKDAKHEARLEDWILSNKPRKHSCFCCKECFIDYYTVSSDK